MVTFFCSSVPKVAVVEGFNCNYNRLTLLHVIVLSQNYDVCVLLVASCTTSSPELFPKPKMGEAILYGEKPLLSVQILGEVQK